MSLAVCDGAKIDIRSGSALGLDDYFRLSRHGCAFFCCYSEGPLVALLEVSVLNGLGSFKGVCYITRLVYVNELCLLVIGRSSVSISINRTQMALSVICYFDTYSVLLAVILDTGNRSGLLDLVFEGLLLGSSHIRQLEIDITEAEVCGSAACGIDRYRFRRRHRCVFGYC